MCVCVCVCVCVHLYLCVCVCVYHALCMCVYLSDHFCFCFIVQSDTDPIQGFDSTDRSVLEYDPLVLQCPQPLSSPPATISWLVDNTPLNTDSHIGITLKGHLVISYTTVADNSNRYSCRATNPKDSTITQTSSSVLLSVSSTSCMGGPVGVKSTVIESVLLCLLCVWYVLYVCMELVLY